MRRKPSSNSRLQGRIQALQQELSRVESEIKGIARAVESDDPEKVARRLSKLAAPPEPASLTRPVSGVEPEGRASGALPASARAVGVRGGAPEAEFLPELPDDMTVPKAATGERFANYFATGSLHSMRPLRQERRVQRNKALFMLILAILVVAGVINMIF